LKTANCIFAMLSISWMAIGRYKLKAEMMLIFWRCMVQDLPSHLSSWTGDNRLLW